MPISKVVNLYSQQRKYEINYEKERIMLDNFCLAIFLASLVSEMKFVYIVLGYCESNRSITSRKLEKTVAL